MPYTVTNNEDRIQSTVLIDHVTNAPIQTDMTNETDKRDTHKEREPPSLEYHAMMEPTKLSTLLKGSSGISEPAMTFNMSSVSTDTNHMTIPSKLPTTLVNTLLRNIGVTDNFERNHQSQPNQNKGASTPYIKKGG